LKKSWTQECNEKKVEIKFNSHFDAVNKSDVQEWKQNNCEEKLDAECNEKKVEIKLNSHSDDVNKSDVQKWKQKNAEEKLDSESNSHHGHRATLTNQHKDGTDQPTDQPEASKESDHNNKQELQKKKSEEMLGTPKT
jgi:hypothetical protein